MTNERSREDELALAGLRAELGDRVVLDEDVLEGVRQDQATWLAAATPLALARPSSTAEVQSLARWASRHRIALVARGAGTGVAGGASSTERSVVVSFERMNRILAIDEAAMLAVVQPGVINAALKDAAAERGLWYPPDPSSYDISTLGGNSRRTREASAA